MPFLKTDLIQLDLNLGKLALPECRRRTERIPLRGVPEGRRGEGPEGGEQTDPLTEEFCLPSFFSAPAALSLVLWIYGSFVLFYVRPFSACETRSIVLYSTDPITFDFLEEIP